MTQRTWIVSLLLTFAMTIATWFCGWWGVAPVALLFGLFAPRSSARPGLQAGIAAGAAWLLLLVFDAASGAIGPFMGTLQGFLGRMTPALALGTILFPALIAWSGALLAFEVRGGRNAAVSTEP